MNTIGNASARFTFVLCLFSVVLGAGGCGVTKLWGEDEANAGSARIQNQETLRELAAKVSEPVWEVEASGSWIGRVAGVLISGEEDADTATVALEIAEDEGKSVKQAVQYLQSKNSNEDLENLAQQINRDAKFKNQEIGSFLEHAQTDLSYRLDQRDKAVFSPDKKNRPSLKKVLNEADDDRRSVAQVEKAIGQQYEVFVAARDIISGQGKTVDLSGLDTALEELKLKLNHLGDLAKAFRINNSALG
jgi:hypothetical protein